MLRILAILLLGGLFQALAVAATGSSCSIRDAAAVEQKVWLLCDEEQLFVTQDQGKSWQADRLPAGLRFRAVAFLDYRRGFVAGDNGTLMATENGGDNWRQVKVPVQDHLTAIHFVGESGWVAGYGGVILHSDDGGRTWTQQPTGVAQALESVFFADAARGWAVGWMGTILRTTDGGRTWKQVPTSTMLWSLSSVYFRDAQNGWIVGFHGQILRSRDGGATWEVQTSPVSASLTSVLFDSSGRGWIAAGNDILTSADGGESWKPVPLDAPLFLSRMLSAKDALWAVGQYGMLKQASDGQKWQKIEKPAAAAS